MMTPGSSRLLRGSMCAAAARAQKNAPFTLTAKVCSQWASVICSMGSSISMPALLTHTSMVPHACSAAATIACTAASSRTSPGNSSACPPASRTAAAASSAAAALAT